MTWVESIKDYEYMTRWDTRERAISYKEQPFPCYVKYYSYDPRCVGTYGFPYDTLEENIIHRKEELIKQLTTVSLELQKIIELENKLHKTS